MSSFDEIKKRLNIDELDKETRNNMFNKFVEKGGKVVEEKTEKKIDTTKFNKETQKLIDEKIRRKNEEIKRRRSSMQMQFDEQKNKKPKRYFLTYLNGLFQGVFTLSNKFSQKFSNGMQLDLNNILSSLNYFTGFIFNLDPQKKWEAVDILNKNNPYSYKIIMRIYNLYKVNSVTRIQEYCKKFNNIICNQIIDDIILLYKEILILYPHWESIKDILMSSMNIYKSITSQEPMISHIKLNKLIDSLFGYYFPSFHLIINYNLGNKIPFEYNIMYELANIKSDEEMGIFTKGLAEEKRNYIEQTEKEKEERKKVLQESIDKKEMEKIPNYIKKGLKLIDSIIEKIPLKMNEDTKTKLLEPNEKMLFFYFLFKEFDKEYSFILTTSQIKISPRTFEGKKIDLKTELEELNIKFNEINSFLKEYFSLMEQFHEINIQFKNSPIGLQQNKSILNIKRTQTFNEIRVRSTYFFRRFSLVLQKLINDYNGERLLIQNGDDFLHFHLELGEKRKFENISIIKSIVASFTFSSAFHYYISVDKLSSKSLYIDDQSKSGKKNDNQEENIISQV